jgi:hypothetical protein
MDSSDDDSSNRLSPRSGRPFGGEGRISYGMASPHCYVLAVLLLLCS